MRRAANTRSRREGASGVTGPDTEPEERVSVQSAELAVFFFSRTAIRHVILLTPAWLKISRSRAVIARGKQGLLCDGKHGVGFVKAASVQVSRQCRVTKMC